MLLFRKPLIGFGEVIYLEGLAIFASNVKCNVITNFGDNIPKICLKQNLPGTWT